ncbi:MFS transporter [Thalassobaculum sp. OXR-137]|uniref:MFS transporter n=1 Tax=Thalassobaculum sp. OXR-137 TaxID=3100173 RepID=UPI002AC94C27|nr:MFS transporter [Thalassobaculum sp. OXR-137]WPZ34613.1 MFS transporter [Thalassobaculum sp. OXR-137]
MNRFTAILPGIALMGLSLLMFAYVGYGEATRVYTGMRVDRVIQLGATLQHTMNQFAQSGLPLTQFSGFERRAEQLGGVDGAIHAISLTDHGGKSIACVAVRAREDGSSCASGFELDASKFRHDEALSDTEIAEHDETTVLRLPVTDKFGEVGYVLLLVDGPTIRGTVDSAFLPVFIAAGLLFLIFGSIQTLVVLRDAEAARRWLRPSFIAGVAIMVAVLVVVMFELYRKGVEGQAEGLARSMAARLTAVTEIGIPIDALTGIREALTDYRRINPQIAAITLTEYDPLHRITDQKRVGAPTGDGTVSFSQPIDPGNTLVLTAELPFSVIVEALGAGARNFAALFFGCVLFATIFFRAVRAGGYGASRRRIAGTAGLAILQPAYFLGILADSLTLTVLPEISHERVVAEGLPAGLVSLPFSLFFVGLTAALIPASILTERMNLRALFMIGAAAVAGGLFVVGGVDSFWALCVGRALGGIGQGVLLVAVQAYAFEIVSSQERVRAAAAQVLGYNGGLIVGTGIGGLLAVFMNDSTFVLMAGVVGVVSLVYIRCVLPSLVKEQEPQPIRLFGDVRRVLVFPDFLALLTMIGVTSKFALAGVAIFAMPLVLHRSGYGDDEVGQALMVFAIVTYLVTAVAPRLVKLFGSTDRALVVGMVSLALGMAGLGLVTGGAGGSMPHWLIALVADVQAGLAEIPISVASGAAIALSVALLGVGQGLIAAPIIARVAAGGAAGAVGRDRTIAVYRILERIGHISGPALVGLLLVTASNNPAALTALGIGYAMLALLYGLASMVMRERAPA